MFPLRPLAVLVGGATFPHQVPHQSGQPDTDSPDTEGATLSLQGLLTARRLTRSSKQDGRAQKAGETEKLEKGGPGLWAIRV